MSTPRLAFGGVPGNALMIVFLPLFTAYLFFAVKFNGGALLPGPDADWPGFLASLQPTWQAAAVYVGWFGFQALLQAWVPGPVVEGTPLPDGRRLRYRMNGLASLAITLGVAFGGHAAGMWSIGFLADEFGALLSVMTLFAFAFSAFLYVWGRRDDRSTGIAVHDFWMGTGHNPRLTDGGLFDLKFFCEARPGLILWMLVDASFAYVQWRTYGFVSTSMWLVVGLQWLYVLDYFWNERAILTTMDIKHENFGFMLAFGDLVWVPMTYSLQAAYLVHHVHDLPVWAAVGVVAMAVAGLAIFRAVNNQKNRFRGDPSAPIWGREPEFLETEQGGKLLLSGFWGWSRHFNYVGDELMAVAWSLPCGFGSLLPWFYPIYFAVLLVHRERRDDELCHEKYGADWERYRQRVRWRIVPGIY